MSTETITVFPEGLRPGDTIVQVIGTTFQIEREVPVPEPGSFGTATVGGETMRGFITGSGGFCYYAPHGTPSFIEGGFTDFKPFTTRPEVTRDTIITLARQHDDEITDSFVDDLMNLIS